VSQCIFPIYSSPTEVRYRYESPVPQLTSASDPSIVAYLASDHAANISGHVFGASRGRVALYSKPVEVKGLYKKGVWTPEELIELVPKIFLQ